MYLFIRKFHGERAALLAGLAYAVYPLAWYRLPLLNTEIIQGAALGFWLLGAAQLVRYRRKGLDFDAIQAALA